MYPCGNTELIVVVVVVFDKLIKTRSLSFVDFLLSSFQHAKRHQQVSNVY